MGDKIRVRKSSAKTERLLVTGAVVSTEVVRGIGRMGYEDYLNSTLAKTVLRWCSNFYDEHGTAPRDHIEDIYAEEVDNGLDPDVADLVAEYLTSLSETYELEGMSDEDEGELINAPYVLKKAEDLFTKRALKNKAEQMQGALLANDLVAAERISKESVLPKVEMVQGVDPFDGEEIKDAFAATLKPLFTVPDPLGHSLMNEHLVRGGFVHFLAPPKRGKSWWLMQMALWAACQNLRVAFFQAGDMDKQEQIARMSMNIAGRSNKAKYCKNVITPVLDCEHNQANTCTIKRRLCHVGIDTDVNGARDTLDHANSAYSPCTACLDTKDNRRFKPTVWWEREEEVEVLTALQAKKEARLFSSQMKGRGVRMFTYPNGTLSLNDVENHLDILEMQEDWVADVLIVDYMDLLMIEKGTGHMENRHQKDELWKRGRGLASARELLFLSASQTDAEGMERTTLSMRNFSNDMRMLAHATAVFGVNMTPLEKKQYMSRINFICGRHGEEGHTVKVLQCLQRGRPFVDAFV